jgi:hypothetical protein
MTARDEEVSRAVVIREVDALVERLRALPAGGGAAWLPMFEELRRKLDDPTARFENAEASQLVRWCDLCGIGETTGPLLGDAARIQQLLRRLEGLPRL